MRFHVEGIGVGAEGNKIKSGIYETKGVGDALAGRLVQGQVALQAELVKQSWGRAALCGAASAAAARTATRPA